MLIALLAFGAWPVLAAGQDDFENKFENEDGLVQWNTSISKEKVIREEQFYATLDLVSTIKDIPGGAYKVIIELVNKLPASATISYEVIGRKGNSEDETFIGSYEITKSLPDLKKGTKLDFLDEKIPTEGYLAFPIEAEFGRYTLYARFVDIEAKVKLVVKDVTKDITGLIEDYLPPGTFDTGIELADIELIDAPPPEATLPRVIAILPADDASDVQTETGISITFNEPVEESSAEASFSITPSASGEFTWEDNTLIFTPDKKLSHNSTYKVAIGTGVRDLTGTPLTEELEWTFTTESSPSRWWVWLTVGIVIAVLLIYSLIMKKGGKKIGWPIRRSARL